MMIKNKFSYESTEKDIQERDVSEDELELETIIFRRFGLAGDLIRSYNLSHFSSRVRYIKNLKTTRAVDGNLNLNFNDSIRYTKIYLFLVVYFYSFIL